MLKAQILAKLKAKHSGLSNEFLGFVADKLDAKITEESQIEGAIDELDKGAISLADQASFFQSESDRRVTAAKAKWEADNKKPGATKTSKKKEDDDEGQEGDETKKELEALKEKFEAFTKNQTTQSLTEKLHLKLKEKNIPLTFAKGRTVDSEEKLDELVGEIETDFNEVKQGFTNQGLSQMSGTPAGGTATKETVVSDIDNWAKSSKPVTSTEK